MTIGEAYGPAMEIQDQEAADAYFEKLVEMAIKDGKTRTQAEVIQRSNLGYFAGYYDSETRARVERLFRCAHPIFGSIKQNGIPTPEAAFEMGQKLGAKIKNEK